MQRTGIIIETGHIVTATRLTPALRKYDNFPLIALSALIHLTLLGLLIGFRLETSPASVAIDTPVEVVFEVAAASLPEATPTETVVAPISEPVASEPIVAVPAESSEPLTQSPAPVLAAPVPQPLTRPVPVPPQLAKSRPAATRPPSPIQSAPAMPALSALPARSVPSPSAPPTVAPSASAGSAEFGWRSALSSWLASHKRYPERAKRRGDEGTVSIHITVDLTGRVLDVAVIRSSGSTLLDDAARNMLAGQRVPPFPPGMTQAQLTVPANIRFSLRDDL